MLARLNTAHAHSTSPSAYLELLKKHLIDYHNIGGAEYHPLPVVDPNWKTRFLYPIDRLLRKRNFAICKLKEVNEHQRTNGLDWPAQAKTMIGYHRLSNIEQCLRTVLADDIAGDVMETGVWRGGATMYEGRTQPAGRP